MEDFSEPNRRCFSSKRDTSCIARKESQISLAFSSKHFAFRMNAAELQISGKRCEAEDSSLLDCYRVPIDNYRHFGKKGGPYLRGQAYQSTRHNVTEDSNLQ
jgi:hypothetical protein